jgi:hypothetical protein
MLLADIIAEVKKIRTQMTQMRLIDTDKKAF